MKSPTVHRCFDKYTSAERSNKQASHRQGHVQKHAVGEFYYVSDLVPGIAFPTRGRAEAAEMAVIAKQREAA